MIAEPAPPSVLPDELPPETDPCWWHWRSWHDPSDGEVRTLVTYGADTGEWSQVDIPVDQIDAERLRYRNAGHLLLDQFEFLLVLDSLAYHGDGRLAERSQADLEAECEYVGRTIMALRYDRGPHGREFWELAGPKYEKRYQALHGEIARRANLARAEKQRQVRMADRRIPDGFVERVKREYSLEELVRRLLPGSQIRRSAGIGMMLCPFHTEKTPSCAVYADHFYCFGCGATGDIFDLYERVHGGTAFVDCVLRVAELLGIRLPEPKPYTAPKYESRPDHRSPDVVMELAR